MDGQDRRDFEKTHMEANYSTKVFRSADDDVAGLLVKAAGFLDNEYDGHAEALYLDYDDTGVSLTLYLPRDGEPGGRGRRGVAYYRRPFDFGVERTAERG